MGRISWQLIHSLGGAFNTYGTASCAAFCNASDNCGLSDTNSRCSSEETRSSNFERRCNRSLISDIFSFDKFFLFLFRLQKTMINDDRAKRFVRRFKRKFYWFLFALSLTIICTTVTIAYGHVETVTIVTVCILTVAGSIVSYKQYLVDFIHASVHKFGRVLLFPPVPKVGKYPCCKRCSSLFLKLFGDDNPDEDHEEFAQPTASTTDPPVTMDHLTTDHV